MKDYTLTSPARFDLKSIYRFIAKDNAIAAARIIDELFALFEKIAKQPYLGHPNASLTKPNILVRNCYSYLVIYHATSKPIRILRVVHGSRNLVELPL